MASPRPLPTKIKKLTGNRSGKPLNDREPEPEVVAPDCPPHLEADAKEKWNDICEKLNRCGILTEIDIDLLERYCQTHQRYVDALRGEKKHGSFTTAESGYMAVSPFNTIINQSLGQLNRMAAEMGMTPSSRSRIQVKKKDKKNEFSDI